jgi:tRNA threonylcarbamoyladenosine biosynthesis protein TsaE
MVKLPLALESSSAAQTEQLAGELAEALRPGDVVLLTGELGAGKTTFVRGAARALGVSTPVRSPTFVIGHRYPSALATIAHVDLYRIGKLSAEEDGLLEDYLGSDKITFVEWPGAAGEELTDARLSVTLSHLDQCRRLVQIVEL